MAGRKRYKNRPNDVKHPDFRARNRKELANGSHRLAGSARALPDAYHFPLPPPPVTRFDAELREDPAEYGENPAPAGFFAPQNNFGAHSPHRHSGEIIATI